MDREGILYICKLENTAAPGFMPVDKLVPIVSAYYRKRTVGYNRMYAALGADQQIDLLLRCFHTPTLAVNAEYCIPEDGNQYRITLKQKIDADTYDLTVVRLEDNYDVQTSDT